MRTSPPELLALARDVMLIEARAIERAAARLNDEFLRAVQLLATHSGKVVTMGIGKSGIVARKLAGTLSSTGRPAVYLHPAEAAHGDLGLIDHGDPVVLVSHAGTTAELLQLVPALKRLECPRIGLIGHPRSPLAAEVDILLDVSVEREADPGDLIPTASTVTALAVADALAIAVMHARQVTIEDFAERHPAGQLGRNLRLRVGEVMHRGESVAWVRPDDPLREVVIAMTSRPLGAACVVDEQGVLVGLITDGDLRRALRRHEDIRPLRARDVMTVTPVTIGPEARLMDALRLMEERPSQIAQLPVVDPATGRCLGLIRLHDICQAWLR